MSDLKKYIAELEVQTGMTSDAGDLQDFMYENAHHSHPLGPDGMTSLREYAGYHGGGSDLVGSCGRGTHRVKVWMQPCAQLYPWQCPRRRSGTQ